VHLAVHLPVDWKRMHIGTRQDFHNLVRRLSLKNGQPLMLGILSPNMVTEDCPVGMAQDAMAAALRTVVSGLDPRFDLFP
jgi:hypothetical protein